MALSSDGTTLAAGTTDRVLRFDATTLVRRGRPLITSAGAVVDVAFSHDGRLLATASEGATEIWDSRSGARLHRFVDSPNALAFAADDRRLYTADGAGVVRAWSVDGATRQLALGEEGDRRDPVSVASVPAPDGHTVARVASGRLWLEDTRSGTTPWPPARLEGGDVQLVWSPDSRWLLSIAGPAPGSVGSGGAKSTVTLWDASQDGVAVTGRRFLSRATRVLATFSPDAERVLVHDGTYLHTLDRATMRPEHPARTVPLDANEMVSGPDGTVLVLHRFSGLLLRVDPRTGERLDTASGLLGPDDVHGVMSPDGTRVLVTGPGVRLRLLDLETMSYLGPRPEWQWGSPAFAPDGSQYAIAGEGRIRLWDGRTGEYLASLPLPDGLDEPAIMYRPDSRSVVIAAPDGRAWVADTHVSGWVGRACAVAGRNLAEAEWQEYFPNLRYASTCPQWPAGA